MLVLIIVTGICHTRRRGPGPRVWAPNAYAAYARDLDGNKLAAYSFKAA
ncbi:Glyoxalase/bleomycin resistance protein/dioxygenase [Pseudomonas sp. G5(2012)]|nr:Glyoxalase/bleomycin resistance protein/dioxygenase [Pseudomonas sp. G5(2012)]